MGGKGNPIVDDKVKTHYLWEDVLLKDSLLDIIKKFYYIQTEEIKDAFGKTKKKTRAIFPRYHQLDVVRKVEKDVLALGVGQKYLIQHSAGSGKTNSISWLSHRLANLHNEKNENVFTDSVSVRLRIYQRSECATGVFGYHDPGIHVSARCRKSPGPC